MSLINHVLTDLAERRGGVPVGMRTAFSDLCAAERDSASECRPAAPARRWLVLLLVAACVLWLAAPDRRMTAADVQAMVRSGSDRTAPIADPPAAPDGVVRQATVPRPLVAPAAGRSVAVPPQEATVEPSPETLAPAAGPTPPAQVIASAAPAPEIVHLSVEAEPQGVVLKLVLSAPARYSVQTGEDGQVILELSPVQLREGYTQRFDGNRLIHGVEVAARGDRGLGVSFALRDGARLAGDAITRHGDEYVLALHIAAVSAATASPRPAKPDGPVQTAAGAGATAPAAKSGTRARFDGQTARKPAAREVVPESARVATAAPMPAGSAVAGTGPAAGHESRELAPAQAAADRASSLLQAAVAAVGQGDRGRAMAILEDALVADARHLQARLLAATLLFEDQRLGEARALLEQGLTLFPEQPRLTAFYGRVLVEQGDLDRALKVLAQAPPPVGVDPEYHALMAALMQRAGRHAEAITAYRRCLTAQPENGVWWLGLGISLSSDGQSPQALDAFNRALSDVSLSANLRRYANDQIARLREAKG